ncbi:MAG: ComF family protein [Pseudomonadota bacterium]
MGTLIQFFKSEFLSGQCFLCKKQADIQSSLCASCCSQLPKNNSCCSICANPLNSEQLNSALICASCQQKTPRFDRVFSPFLYQHKMIELIPAFKYHAKLFLGKTLAKLFIQQYSNQAISHDLPELIIPVPLHIKRLKHRGFNQSSELANYFSQQWGIKIDDQLVERIKITHTQKGLTLKQRKNNLKNAFRLVAGKKLNNKHVVIVDDVITTANTVNEIARVLKQAGASRVDVWTIARA